MSDLVLVKYQYYPFIHNVRKLLNILLKSCGVHTARFLKQIWPFSTFYMKGLNDLNGLISAEPRQSQSLREKCPYSEFLWYLFSRIQTEYGEIRSKFSPNAGKY